MNKLIVALPKSIRQQQQIHAAFESILSHQVVTYSSVVLVSDSQLKKREIGNGNLYRSILGDILLIFLDF